MAPLVVSLCEEEADSEDDLSTDSRGAEENATADEVRSSPASSTAYLEGEGEVRDAASDESHQSLATVSRSVDEPDVGDAVRASLSSASMKATAGDAESRSGGTNTPVADEIVQPQSIHVEVGSELDAPADSISEPDLVEHMARVLEDAVSEGAGYQIFQPLDGTSLYTHVCTMNHSCDPNVEVIYRTPSSGRLQATVVALRDLSPGEELFFSYIDLELGLEGRQTALKDYGFACTCKKCAIEGGFEAKEGTIAGR